MGWQYWVRRGERDIPCFFHSFPVIAFTRRTIAAQTVDCLFEGRKRSHRMVCIPMPYNALSTPSPTPAEGFFIFLHLTKSQEEL